MIKSRRKVAGAYLAGINERGGQSPSALAGLSGNAADADGAGAGAGALARTAGLAELAPAPGGSGVD
jgi:hypothetical protein